MRENDFRQFNYNILGEMSSIKGHIILSGDAIISSHIEGTIEVLENGKLTLERNSFVKGNIKAMDLEVFGKVEGDIECSGLISIRSSAEITGSIKSATLVIYPGAILEVDAHSENLA